MTIKLSKWQTSVWDDTKRYKVINCGRRAGKSTITALKAVDFAAKRPRSIVWYIAPTYKQAHAIMWQILGDLIPRHAIAKKNEQEMKFLLTNGSQILLKGAENPDSLRGVRIDLCIFDECAFIGKWNEVWKVVRPTLIDSKAETWFISTPNGFNHFKEMAERQDPDWSYHHYTSYDNPYLDEAEINKVKEEMDDDSFAQEVMGEFKKMSGLVYKGFNRDVHMIDIPNFDYNWTFTRTVDFGFAHKTALGYFAINTTGTEIIMYDGIYKSGLTNADLAAAIKIKDAGKVISNPVADSAQPLNIEELEQLGVHFAPIEKGADSVMKGISSVAELLKVRADTGKPTLMFNKSLTWVADEFENYRWVQNISDGFIREVPLKRDDDAMDMIRYFAMEYKKPAAKFHQRNSQVNFQMP